MYRENPCKNCNHICNHTDNCTDYNDWLGYVCEALENYVPECVQVPLDQWEKIRQLYENDRKYRWHDLQKNPDDLPDTEKLCEVVIQRTYSDYKLYSHASFSTVGLSDSEKYWCDANIGYLGHETCSNHQGKTLKVIKWRYIEDEE